MAQQKHVYNVTLQTASGIMTRAVDADNMFQAREKIKASYGKNYARGEVKIISVVKLR